MSINDIQVFRDSVAKVVHALTNSNIKVVQRGMDALVEYDSKGNPIQVVLPTIPDNAPRDLLNAVQGFLDHEVGHVLETDFAHSSRMNKKCAAAGDKMTPALWNVVEDVMIERKMTKRFAGSRINLDNIQRYVSGKLLKEHYDKFVAAGAPPSDMVSLLLPSAIRAAAGQDAFVDFMKDKWHHMSKYETAIREAGQLAAKANSTTECWNIAEKTMKAMKLPPMPPPPPPPPAPQQKSDDKNKGNKGDNDGEQGDDPDKENNNDANDEAGDEQSNAPQDKPDEGEGEGEDDQGEGSQGEDDGEDDDSTDDSTDDGDGGEDDGEDDDSTDDGDDGDDANDNDNGDDEGDGKGAVDGESKKDEASSSDEGSDDADSGDNGDSDDEGAGDPSDSEHERGNEGGDHGISDELDPDLIKSMDDLASEAISKDMAEYRHKNPSDYVPFSRDLDYIGPHPQLATFMTMSPDATCVYEKATTSCHVVQGEIERVFRARSASRWNPGQRKGKLNRNALHRVAMGDDRAFRTKIEAQNRDVAVSLVIDCSGSMSGSKITNAAIAAYMLSTVLERINVPHETLGFTTCHAPQTPEHRNRHDWKSFERAADEARSKNYSGYGRYAPLALYVFKEYQKRFGPEERATLQGLPTAWGYMMNNLDGESIELAASRLAQRREARKVMIVMSDGQPAGDGSWTMQQDKLHHSVEMIERSNIEVYALGLQDRSVLHYYKKAEVIDNADEIPAKVISLVQRLLTG